MSDHFCHARGCQRPVPPSYLMCGAHWGKVHTKIQRAVWAAYRRGQEIDKRPSMEWLIAAGAAIGYVALLEGRLTTVGEQECLEEMGFAVAELQAAAPAKNAVSSSQSHGNPSPPQARKEKPKRTRLPERVEDRAHRLRESSQEPQGGSGGSRSGERSGGRSRRGPIVERRGGPSALRRGAG